MGEQVQGNRENSSRIKKIAYKFLTQNATQASLIFMATTLTSKLLGFLRDILVGAYFGTTRAADALTAMIPVNSAFQDVVNGALVVAMIPLFIESLEIDQEKAKNDLSVVFSYIFLILLIISIGLIVFSGPISRLLLPGFSEQIHLRIAESLLDIFAVSSLLWALTDLLFGAAQSEKHFLITALLPLLANTSIIISLLSLHNSIGILSYPVGVASGALLQLLIMIIYGKKILGLKFRLNFNSKNTFLFKLFIFSIPLILQQVLNYAVTFTANGMASKLSEGSVAALSYANKLRLLSIGVLTTPLAVSFYPFLSQAASEKRYDQLKDIYSKSIRFASLLVAPVMLVSVFFAETIIKIVYHRGAFNAQAVLLTVKPFQYYSLGIFAMMIVIITMRLFYSLKKMNITLIVSAIGAIINIVLFYTLTKTLEHSGIALSISITLYIEAFIFFVLLKREIGNFGFLKIIFSIFKIFLAAALGVLGMYFVFIYLGGFNHATNTKIFISFSESAMMFIMIYIPVLSILKVSEVKNLMFALKKLFKR